VHPDQINRRRDCQHYSHKKRFIDHEHGRDHQHYDKRRGGMIRFVLRNKAAEQQQKRYGQIDPELRNNRLFPEDEEETGSYDRIY
jgi:hypothetical protein